MMEISDDVVTAFRGFHHAFFSAESWPDSLLVTHLCDADAETGGRGWGAYEDACGNFKQRGMFAYAAHSLLSEYPQGFCSNTVSSSPRNAVASKSVGDESVSYSVPQATSAGDSWLSSTSYGQRFILLRRRAGMGAIAL